MIPVTREIWVLLFMEKLLENDSMSKENGDQVEINLVMDME